MIALHHSPTRINEFKIKSKKIYRIIDYLVI